MADLGKLVMVVDDKENNRKLVTTLLASHGYHVVSAVSGPDCLSLLTRLRPNLIILDIMMPDMDGFETCRRIRAESALRKVPILFLTAFPFVENVQKGLNAGGNDFIAKPYDIDVLTTRVAALLAPGSRPPPMPARRTREPAHSR